MRAANLVKLRKAILSRIVTLIDDDKFPDHLRDDQVREFHCLNLAHQSICDELKFVDREPVTQTVKAQLELVLGVLADAANRDPHANSGYREAATALRFVIDNEVPF